MRAFFGYHSDTNVLFSSKAVDPSRSPFMKKRLEVMVATNTMEEIIEYVKTLQLDDATFKITCINDAELEKMKKLSLPERRQIERKIGLEFKAEVDFEQPDHHFGVLNLHGRWYFGYYEKSEAVWHHHIQKPRSYSTALSTRLARAVVNIAVPDPAGLKVIDPCCGIGTVLVEALSMGIDIIGRDKNPLVTTGSRENIAYFGLKGNVQLGPISDVTDDYDVAIIDLPYNIYTHITSEQTFDIIRHARRIAKKAVIITIDSIDELIEAAGFTIVDRCIAKKSTFSREILVCS
ncbi:RNA methyltransferase [Bacillus sp. FJAT-50079]|uniref:TRM11 family SAM-dependent methyltransferase n=1 Tax=Bacillus sp. FJAT-50079 TaxID=2833577 RepID=UPI001BC90749|nr:RNA methyltransferase [Bacillus sp. FJAT-50079]MBS4209922.1 RNA methyltransferase [Bacillus sp. FJAT-50079]